MNKLIIMCGISASGKSTCAKELSVKENATIVSSDKIRAELGDISDQSQNEKVFQIFYKRIKQLMIKNEDVVADATFLTIKSRKQIIEMAKRYNYYIECDLVVKDINSCIKDDNLRQYSVGERVILKQVKRFQIPFKEEGLNKIKIVNNVKAPVISDYVEFHKQLDCFVQHNKYHNMAVGKHQRLSYAYAKNNNYPLLLLKAIQSHDIGKLFTQTFDENNQAHYYSHENYGAYLRLCDFLYDIYNVIDDEYEQYALDIVFYINYHMVIQNSCTTEKSTNKYRKLFGEEKYNNLLLMYKADKYRE